MLNLKEYKSNNTSLCDYLPWACLVAPGIVLNKDGSFQRTFRYRGPDLDSATEAELVSVTARINNVLKRFGDGWALFFEAERRPALAYPGARITTHYSAAELSRLLDAANSVCDRSLSQPELLVMRGSLQGGSRKTPAKRVVALRSIG